MSILDLSDPLTCPSFFGYDNDYPKYTPTGLSFWSYKCLRQYLITGSVHNAYLQGWGQGLNHPYVHVPNLKEQLEESLRLEIAGSLPFIKMRYNRKTEVVWLKPHITQEELEWVEIIRNVLKDLK